ncbi:ABC transporter ATP-binding protein [Sinobaca sp. H24]|uniref:ABC transporter ATP-binding protein n=1 Tax=Sinobaca sp. H24 TaxID=2923376 RepID=UPI00207ABBA2|nr:ATP-binding cassette domain-containing protein [Sinobaca sp. H24]
MEALLSLQSISKAYGRKRVLDDVSLDIARGSLTAIQGRSGSGKSTLLNIMAGLETKYRGSYHFQSIAMHSRKDSALADVRRSNMGYITQHTPVIPNVTLWDNVCFPVYAEKNSLEKQQKIARAEDLLYKLGIESLRDNKVAELSGGELKRLGIARALLSSPELLLADEPTGSLDDETAEELISLFHTLHQERTTIVIVTHSNKIASECTDKWLLKDGRLQ